MVKPIALDLIDAQAVRFREEFETFLGTDGDGQGDDMPTWTIRIQKLEVNVFFILNAGVLNGLGIDHPRDLRRWAKAKATERRKSFEALGGVEKTGLSEDDFHEICKLAAKVL